MFFTVSWRQSASNLRPVPSVLYRSLPAVGTPVGTHEVWPVQLPNIPVKLRLAKRVGKEPLQRERAKAARSDFMSQDSLTRGLGARTSGPHVFTFHRGHATEAAPGPALISVSPFHFISKWLCAGDMRTGGPRTQETSLRYSKFLSLGFLQSPLFPGRSHFASGNPCCAGGGARAHPAHASEKPDY